MLELWSVMSAVDFTGQLTCSSVASMLTTPDYVHLNAAIGGFDYARSPQEGARMIVANIFLEEVREAVVTYETKKTQNPTDAPRVDTGEQQPAAATESVLSRVVDTISSENGLLEQAETLGAKAMEAFRKFVGGTPGVLTP